MAQDIFQFDEEHVTIDQAIKILKIAKAKGSTGFFSVHADGDYNYKTKDCNKNLRLIFTKKE
tara:strand:+ start:29319 stop:29504 length:186 start_codon:yes stop_codon:yes gene_type:complete